MGCLSVLPRTPGGAEHQGAAILAALDHALKVQPTARTAIPPASLRLAIWHNLPTSGAPRADAS